MVEARGDGGGRGSGELREVEDDELAMMSWRELNMDDEVEAHVGYEGTFDSFCKLEGKPDPKKTLGAILILA